MRTSFALQAALAVVLATFAPGAARATVIDAPPDAGAVDRDAPTVTARLVQTGAEDKTTFHVGDAIGVVVTAISRRNVPVNLPGTLDLGGFSVLDRKENEKDLGDGRVQHEFALTVASYEPGEREIPAIEVTYLGKGGDVRTARTAALPIKITSLIANEPEPTLKDAAGPVVVMEENLLLVYVGVAVLAAALGALLTYLIVRRMRARVAARPGPPPRPAHEIALEKLDRLGRYGFLEDADNRPFYFAVSEVIREYLGARFGFDSLELTTDELVAELRRQAGKELILGELQGWLSACDLVKFAKISPSAAEARGSLEMAIRIVTSTRPRPAVVPPEAGPAGGAGAGNEAARG